MATTKKEGAPAKERSSRLSLVATTGQNPRARTTKSSSPVGSSSEKETSHGKPTPNYLKPTFSSSPDAAAAKHAKAAPTTRAPQKSLPIKKVGAEAKPQPQRSSSFTTPRPVRTATTALSSPSSFSDRMSKGKAAAIRSSLKVTGKPSCAAAAKGRASAASSATNSTATSAATSAATSPRATAETMSNEDMEAALDILDLEAEEHVLLEIPPAADKSPLDEPTHVEEAEEPTAFVEHEHVVNHVEVVEDGKHEHHDDADGGEEGQDGEAVEEEKDHEEVVTTVEVAETEEAEKPDEKVMVEGSASDGEGAAAVVVESNEEGVDGGGERVKLMASGEEDEAAEKEKRKEASQQQQHGKKEAAPAYNDVIEETANKLVEKRKSKVLALVGAFETVISLDSGGQGGQ